MKGKIIKQGIKRRVLSLVLALTMAFAFMPMNSMKVYAVELPNGASGACGDGVTYTFDNTDGRGLLTISGTGAMADYDEINRTPFDGMENIKQVVIENGVTSIGNYAFVWCNSLQSITIPAGVTSIGDHAFESCCELQSITIPAGVTSIGDRAFENCNELQSITIPVGVTSIGNNTFSGCISLQSITIPAGVTSIGSEAFFACRRLQSITIPAGVTSIGESAFYGCFGLTSVIFNGTVGTDGDGIASNAFETVGTSGENKTTLTLPESGITGPANNATQWKGGYFALAHDHIWTYTADGATITAKCTGTNDCTVENGKTTGVSLTLSVSNETYSGSPVEASMVKTAWEAADLSAPSIVYEAKSGSALTEGKAVNVGSYTAKITVDGKTATKDFEITNANNSEPEESEDDDSVEDTVSAPALSGTPEASTSHTYTVVKGDTMSTIANKNGLTLAQLAALNPQIKNLSLIIVGQIINVGKNSVPANDTNSNKNNTSSKEYTVKKGDTLSKIAADYKLTLKKIAELNPQIKNIDLIYVGQVIKVN